MRVLRTLLSAGVVLTLTSTASATPIPFAGGLLDGVLRTYTYQSSPTDPTMAVLSLLRDYEVGVDFYPGLPLSFQNGTTPYTRCVQDGVNYAVLVNPVPCLSFFYPVTTEVFGQGDLRDGCTFIAAVHESPPGRPVMVERGNCTFRDKWAFAESEGWGGVLVVNDLDGPVGATGLIPDPSTPEPLIAFMRLTKDVGAQIRTDDRQFSVLLQMSVSWTPNPVVPVSEPGTLALMAGGLAAIYGRRRRRARIVR